MTLEDVANKKPYQTKEYMEHEVFSTLKDLMEFYNALSFNVMRFVTPGITPRIFNIDTYVYSSIAGTLDSIDLVLEKGRINDAFALLRKYHDAIIMDIYKAIYLKKHHSLKNWIVKDIDDWANGKGHLPWYEGMMKDIRSWKILEKLHAYFDFDGHFAKIRKKCNNHNHYNSFQYMIMNDNEVLNQHRVVVLDQLSIYMKDIFTLHFAYTISLNAPYIMDSDYVDALDCGLIPEKDSQYRVVPFAQTIFDKYIKSRWAELAEYLKDSCGMQLE